MKPEMKELIDGLNEDLAAEYGAVIQYTYYAATVTGLYYQVFKPFFEEEIPDEQGHALYLSEKISTYGGTPTTTPAPVKQVTDVKDMLTEASKAELDTIKRYEKRIEKARELGLTELAVTLEDMITDETQHYEKMERMLKDPRLS
ncbi:ferritin-like domain-containing protein [Terrilactibacillus sp. BCM23-1]|uniref:Ferritin-like domain-containing protein n=1 Tax=Terrilactibacillus tamarindi TaxID=2599694 RepID=A0A6N8CMU2_9BACI|nr:ferritin-like domain-containing protein [Terrilactibacillus tamarindi]MTT30487.1 ferritin-like domain-containing protein [Terrilactibacillus tamarindi]